MDIPNDSIISIPLNKLVPSAHNVRKTKRPDDIPELAASILAHGLRQNLNVIERADGKYEVSAGGRRHAALKLLAKDGKIAKDFAVPCKLTPPEIAHEVSLAENVQRTAMDVMDEVEAFAALLENNLTTEYIARRFGCTGRHVEQRLALARLSPKIRAGYRKGELSLDAARAFCLAPDHAAQERLFKQMAKPITHAQSVRRALVQGRIPADDRIVKFVGLEAYEQAGGRLVRDLFEEDCVLLEDGELLHRLAGDKQEGLRQQILSEGWGWAEIAHNGFLEGYASERLRPAQRTPTPEEAQQRAALEAEIEDLDGRLETDEDSDALWDQREQAEARWDQLQQSLSAWDPEQMALAGVSIEIDHAGAPRITRGLIRRADLKALNKLRRAAQPDGGNGAGDETQDATSRPQLPRKLIEQLTTTRTCALRTEIAAAPKAALALLIHSLMLQSRTHGGLAGLEIRTNARAFDDSAAFKAARDHAHAAAPRTLEDYHKSSTEDLLSLLAVLVAETINLPHRDAGPQDAQLQASADGIAAMLDLRMAHYWSPDEAFWLQAPKSLALEVLAESTKLARMGVKKRSAQLAAYSKMKKAELARIAGAELRKSGWLPEVLITPAREGAFAITASGEAALDAEAA